MANKTDENRNYAKEAKKRMKGGFWDSKLTEWDNLRSAAEKEGRSPDAEINSDKRALAMQFYHPEQYRKEEEFYARVVKLPRSGETVTNPIKVLSEEEGVDKLPPEKQSQKILELAERYRRMVERYREDSKK